MIFSPILNNGALSSISTFTSPVYDTDGSLLSAVINGLAYEFTYSSGKIATIKAAGITRSFTWLGDQLLSVAVS